MSGLARSLLNAAIGSDAPSANAILNALPHPVLFLNRALEIKSMNQEAETFFQSSSTVLKGRTLSSLLPFGSPIIDVAQQAIHRNVPVFEYRVAIAFQGRADERRIDVNAVPISEDVEGLVLMFLERTMTEKLDRQLTHRGAARTVTGLAAMLAHEIKNPLFGIRGAAQLLETSADENDRTLTRLICDETDRIVRLVDRMEVFSDERPVERAPVNIHVVLERVKSVCRTSFGRDVRMIEHYDPSLPFVYANHDQLIQIFLNLVKNAAEALKDEPEPEITLRTAFRPGIRLSLPGTSDRMSLPLEFSVEDNGPGIPEDLLPHLFDPFITTKTNGTGLGLALVAKIVRDHGGVIDCESRKGSTVFKILLPAFKEEKINE
ncbi:nitrogen regulation protein NR(II) [Pararhizobium sp. IMCC21322]|uniref:two-component system sensor histidine kinase NtrB n=1 Tax=Pararhizobium sp. IMCC21322 TaxID=3067903 RepID=UPI0027410FA3|nr:ATP-binding protein [Pararhizobium sp. IMCC21322]